MHIFFINIDLILFIQCAARAATVPNLRQSVYEE